MNSANSSSIPYSFFLVQALEGEHLILRPLEQKDLLPLASALISAETWFAKTRDLNSVAKFVAYFEPMLDRQLRGESLTLVARKKEDGEFVGMSTFQYPSVGFRRVEIGFTWIADVWQRTFVNSEMKYLMLSHAFDAMKANRVEFSVHPTNEKSNAAMRRLGATFEGTLRKWRFLPGAIPDDGNRNIYSILDDEWPTLRFKLKV